MTGAAMAAESQNHLPTDANEPWARSSSRAASTLSELRVINEVSIPLFELWLSADGSSQHVVLWTQGVITIVVLLSGLRLWWS